MNKKDYTELKGNDQFISTIESSYPCKSNEFESRDEQLSSILLIDLLETFFKKAKIDLPKDIRALDIGAGPWHYAPALYSFLTHFNGQNAAEFQGIDIRGEHWKSAIGKRINNKNIHYHKQDVFDIEEREAYDLIFLIHMFPPYRFKQHGIPFTPYKELFTKIFDLLKVGGYIVAIAYGSPEEEYDFFEEIPKGTLIKKGRYQNKNATQIDFELGRDTFHNNMVMIAQKH